MTTYKIIFDTNVNTREKRWSICKQDTFEKCNLQIDPFLNKLFTDDVFSYDETPKSLQIVHSSVRQQKNIPAVIIISTNKTYGRKKDKLIYKCIPDDNRLPAFLVPYDIKHVGFFKTFPNIYVTIQFTHWDLKHPFANVTQTIGPIDVLHNFYEYQLYCKSLNHSIQNFNKQTSQILHKQENQDHDTIIDNICSKHDNIENRTAQPFYIFTIDPSNSTDFDDAFSLYKTIANNYIVSIYISNVPILLHSLNLWQSFSERISTIYLPDKKRPMLPTVLSDCLCSLQQNTNRIAFTMDLIVDEDGIIQNIAFTNCKIKVSKNYTYEHPDLLSNENYKLLMDVTRKIAKTYKYINNIRNSHELVAYLMILMNYNCANTMTTYKNGIFRIIVNKHDKSNDKNIDNHVDKNIDINKRIDINKNVSHVNDDVHNFIKIWRSSCGQYVEFSSNKDIQHLFHSFLDVDSYIHITSPIRRLVDLLNMIKIQQNLSLFHFSIDVIQFYDGWVSKLDYINTTMRSIRKIQSDCSLLSLFMNDENASSSIYDGYCFDKIIRTDGLYQYNIYIPQLKLASRITTGMSMLNYEKKQYKLFLFNNEENFKRKIRLQLL
jgi:exoribonuclease R